MKVNSILLVEDNRNLSRLLSDFLSNRKGYRIVCAYTGGDGLSELQKETFNAVLLDYKLPDMEAPEFLKKVSEFAIEIPIVIITAYGSVERAVECMKIGASDFITKPSEPSNIAYRLESAIEKSSLIKENQSLKKIVEWNEPTFCGGEDQAIRKLLDTAKRIAKTNASVLITGESGTGKEVLARYIVRYSPRSGKPVVKVDCTGLTEQLLASDLFGHIRGAFTGAVKEKIGRVEVADNGTLFFDEIAELPVNLQSKVMRIIEQREYERLGETKTRNVNIRIIAATNADLKSRVKSHKFREDLFFRLNVVRLHLPPLRERKKDIFLLAEHFLESHARRSSKRYFLSNEVKEFFLKYDWPGNVRELKNILERAVIFCDSGNISIDYLPEDLPVGLTSESDDSLRLHINKCKTLFVRKILEEEDGNIEKAAERLKIHPRYIYQILKDKQT